MSTIASVLVFDEKAEDDPFVSFFAPLGWAIAKVEQAAAVWAVGMLIGGTIEYAVDPLLATVKLQPSHGFWSSMLVGLGLLGLYKILQFASDEVTLNPFDIFRGWKGHGPNKRKEMLSDATDLGLILLCAWLVTTYLLN